MPAFLIYTWHQLKGHPLRALLVLFFFGRLIGITNPPLEVGHSWRQTTVTMVARNFHEVSADILRPRVDMAGELSGITGMEFPLLNYLIHLTSELFGYEHWFGRLIVLVIGSIGIWSFYRLLRRHLNEEVAQIAGIFLLGSIWFSFSRKMMPDVFSASLVIMGLERLDAYLLRNANPIHGLSALILLAAGVLSKLPAAHMMLFALPMLLMAWQNQAKGRFLFVGLGLAVTTGLAYLWYGYWVPQLIEDQGYAHFFMGDTLSQGFSELLEDLPQVFKRFYQTAMGFVGFLSFLSGLWAWSKDRTDPIGWILGLGSMGFSVVMVKAGWAFGHHNYYIVPYVPVMAVLAAHGIHHHLSGRVLLPILVGLFLLEGVLNQVQDFRIKPQAAELVRLEGLLDKQLPEDGLLFVNSGKYPTPLYFAHRKGWIGTNQEIKKEAYRDSLEVLGLKHILILKRAFGNDMTLPEEEVYSDEDFHIYRLVD